MQNRPNEFTLEPINNIMTGSVFRGSNISEGSIPPPPSNAFLLLDTTNFKLLDGTNFLLLG